MKPTSGTAVIAGKDIHTSMFNIRQDMGICLQHDCIFPFLTVREHIQLFCRIKGTYSRMSYVEAEEQITLLLQDVALLEKCESLAKNLSGGMKRKLNVAMAFAGESKVVILVRSGWFLCISDRFLGFRMISCFLLCSRTSPQVGW
jgi:ABC-type multidrug transport system ATPase subunit